MFLSYLYKTCTYYIAFMFFPFYHTASKVEKVDTIHDHVSFLFFFKKWLKNERKERKREREKEIVREKGRGGREDKERRRKNPS